MKIHTTIELDTTLFGNWCRDRAIRQIYLIKKRARRELIRKNIKYNKWWWVRTPKPLRPTQEQIDEAADEIYKRFHDRDEPFSYTIIHDMVFNKEYEEIYHSCKLLKSQGNHIIRVDVDDAKRLGVGSKKWIAFVNKEQADYDEKEKNETNKD